MMNTSTHNANHSPDTNADRDPLGLSKLPELQPPADGWAAIASELQSQHETRRRWQAGLAVAATVLIAAGVVWMLPQPGLSPQNPGNATANIQPVEAGSGTELAEDDSGDPTGNANLQSLVRLSQRLEENLRHLRSGVGAMPAEMVVYQVELEDLVAQVDEAISLQPDSSELWRQRVNLLLDLNQVYGAGLRRDYQQVASL